jgi:hypothetical protein
MGKRSGVEAKSTLKLLLFGGLHLSVLPRLGTRSSKVVWIGWHGMASWLPVSIGVVVFAQCQHGTYPMCGFRGFVISIGLILLESVKTIMINDMTSYNSIQRAQYSCHWN